jgi:hypothetical protein
VYINVVILLNSGKKTENDGFDFNLYSLNLYFRYSDVGNTSNNKGLLDDSSFQLIHIPFLVPNIP